MQAFVTSEITLIVEALARASKRHMSEAKWYQARANDKLYKAHSKKARDMRDLISRMQPLTGLQGTVRP